MLRKNKNLTDLCYVKRNSSGKRLNKSTRDDERAVALSSGILSSSSSSPPEIRQKHNYKGVRSLHEDSKNDIYKTQLIK